MGLVEGRSQYNWEHGIPCSNPQCKSYGKPHPNCQCGGGIPHAAPSGARAAGPSKSVTSQYAEGGNVEDDQQHPCDGPHEPSCEFYAGNSEVGKNILKNAIARHTSEDDVTSSMLGKSHPEQAAHGMAVSSGASGILGNVDDSPFEDPTKSTKLQDIADKQLSKKSAKFLSQVSMESPDKSMHPDYFKEIIRPMISKMTGQKNTHVIDSVIAAISRGETDKLGAIIKHAKSISSGHKSIEDTIESLFSGGDIQQDPDEGEREKLKEFIKSGGLNAQLMNQSEAMTHQPVQAMAHGGEVNTNAPQSPVQRAFPEQSTLLGMAKSTINNYLQQKQPLPVSGMPFDSTYPNYQKRREYDAALDIANKPLSVMKHAQKGTLLPEHVQHLVGMYPDLHDHLSKKITERIMKAQLNEEKPGYRVRQSMSLLLGSPLDSTMTPQAIQSIQGMYAKNQAQKQQTPQGKSKKSTSKLGEASKDHYTQEQASAGRATQWD